MKFSLVTILAMLALGYTTRYSGMDATMGLAFANTGWLYPFFGTLIGWIGVALTGTDAASNALFGSQQVITANKLDLNPTLMAAANSSGGVMGKMIDAQSIVVASVATNYQGKEGVILRYVFWHSIVAGVPGRRAGDAAGLRLAVHCDGVAPVMSEGGRLSLASRTRRAARQWNRTG